MRSLGIAVAHDDPRIVDEVVHALEATTDLYLALDPARASVLLAGPGALARVGGDPPPGVALVALSADGDVAGAARGALACRAHGLVCWPEDRPALASIAREAASRARLRTGGSDGAVLGIVGARGGVGATTVAALLARALPEGVVVDLDAAGAGQVNFAPPDAEAGLPEVMAAIEDLDLETFGGAFVPHAAGRALFAPPRSPAPDRNGVHRLIDLVRASFPFAVLDVGRGSEDAGRAVVERADALVCVCGPDVASVRGARALAAEVDRAIGFVLNGARRWRLGARDLERVLGAPPVAVIPQDPRVRRAGEAGRLPAGGPARRAAGRLADRLAKELAGGR